MLLWTWKCRYLFNILLSFHFDVYPRVRLLDHVIIIFFNLLRNFHTIFYYCCTNLHSHHWRVTVHFFPHPHQHFWAPDFLKVATLIGVRWYLIVVFICIPLMIRCWAPSHACWPLLCLLWENGYSGTCPF